MSDPGQDYDHLLDPISGFTGMYDLQFHGHLGNAQNNHRGSLVSLGDDGLMQLGMASSHAMPMWAINASYDLDVQGGQAWPAGSNPLYRVDAGNMAGQSRAADDGRALRRSIGSFVATGGFELVTTEFDPTAVYNENDPLVPYTPDGTEAAGTYPAGWVTRGTVLPCGLPLDEQQVGVVSRVDLSSTNGSQKSLYNQRVIQFWPVYMPAQCTGSESSSS